MSLLMGALTGLGEGMVDVSNRMQQNDLQARQQQGELLKEQRIRQAAIEDRNYRTQENIAGEQRASQAATQKQKDDLAFQTNPDNVTAIANAENTRTGLLNSAKYKSGDEEAAYQRKIALAKDTSNPEIERLKLEHSRLVNDRLANPDKYQSSGSGKELDKHIKDLKSYVDTMNDQVEKADEGSMEQGNLIKERDQAQSDLNDAQAMRIGRSTSNPGKVSQSAINDPLGRNVPNKTADKGAVNIDFSLLSPKEIAKTHDKLLKTVLELYPDGKVNGVRISNATSIDSLKQVLDNYNKEITRRKNRQGNETLPMAGGGFREVPNQLPMRGLLNQVRSDVNTGQD